MAKHDALFKRIFSAPEHAAGELRTMLPGSLVAQLDLDKLEVVEGSFVSKELRLRHTDLLFRVPFRKPRHGQRYVYVYVLLEHQSRADPDMPFRILEYVVRIWAKLRADEPHRGTLPLVVPLVVHHGARAWSAPRSVHGMVEGLAEHPELRRFVPNLDLLIDDLAVASNAELMGRPLAPVARVASWLLRDGRDVHAVLAHLEFWAALLTVVAEQHPDELEALLRYILLAAGEQSVEDVRRAILIHVPTAEGPLASAGEQLIQQGREQGLQQGLERGSLAALRATLRKQLSARFGSLHVALEARIDAATAPQLDQMLVRVLTATSADEVLGDG
ncbi:MAG: Rpn family recombination-promoting nuclease/putative transposase [Sandaracinaceae bacterium]|nr:Rpn family recombination-promoting nuclease/putative transposase [Sandaracinaceae bacterium]